MTDARNLLEPEQRWAAMPKMWVYVRREHTCQQRPPLGRGFGGGEVMDFCRACGAIALPDTSGEIGEEQP
jgi:hypothetical protein